MDKKLKLKILNEAIKLLENGESEFMCVAIKASVCRKGIDILSIPEVFDYFPELLKHKPKNKSLECAWFNFRIDSKSLEKRLTILRKVKKEIGKQ